MAMDKYVRDVVMVTTKIKIGKDKVQEVLDAQLVVLILYDHHNSQ